MWLLRISRESEVVVEKYSSKLLLELEFHQQPPLKVGWTHKVEILYRERKLAEFVVPSWDTHESWQPMKRKSYYVSKRLLRMEPKTQNVMQCTSSCSGGASIRVVAECLQRKVFLKSISFNNLTTICEIACLTTDFKHDEEIKRKKNVQTIANLQQEIQTYLLLIDQKQKEIQLLEQKIFIPVQDIPRVKRLEELKKEILEGKQQTVTEQKDFFSPDAISCPLLKLEYDIEGDSIFTSRCQVTFRLSPDNDAWIEDSSNSLKSLVSISSGSTSIFWRLFLFFHGQWLSVTKGRIVVPQVTKDTCELYARVQTSGPEERILILSNTERNITVTTGGAELIRRMIKEL